MIKLDIQNLPIEIIEDDTKFNETTYLFFSRKELDVDLLEKYYSKYHKDFNSMDYFENNRTMSSYFGDFDARMRKALSSNYLRFLVKDLFKKVDFKHVSQTRAKTVIAAFITGIIQASCFSSYQNIFKERYMELFENTVKSKDDLYDEFMEILIESLTNMINQANMGNDFSTDKYFLYRELHAKYLIEKNLDEPSEKELHDIKSKIKECLKMTEEEASKQIAIEEEIEEKISEENFKIFKQELLKNPEINKLKETFEEMESIQNKAIIESLKPSNPNLTDDELLKKWEKLSEEFKSDDFQKQMALFEANEYKAQKSFQENFNYNEDEIDSFAEFNKLLIPLLIKFNEWKVNKHDYSFLEYIAIVLQTLQHYSNNESNELEDEEDDDGYDILYDSIEILTLLSYCLWIDDTDEYILNKFKNLMDSTPKCKENFLEMRQKRSSNKLGTFDNIVFTFTPDSTYKNQIITSVLLELNNPTIAKKVKKIILNSNCGKEINQKLNNKNKEHIRLFNTIDDSLLTNKQHEFAIAFMLSYFIDKINIAPFTAFMRYSVNMLDSCENILNCDNVIKSILSEDSVTDNEQLVIDVHEIDKIIDNMIVNTENMEIEDLMNNESIDKLNLALLLSGKSHELYFHFDPIKSIKKYKYRIINYFYVSKNSPNDSQRIKIDEIENHLDLIIKLCIYFYMIDFIDNFKDYMPKDVSIINSETNNQLKETNLKLEEQVNEQRKIIESYSNLKHELTAKKKIDIEKEINKVASSYKKDISSLKKEILEKEEEISKLKENETELFKLREILFKLNQENDIEEPIYKNIQNELKEIIKEKNIFLIGGHSTIIDKLKHEYPSIKSIRSVSDVSEISLSKADHVFMFYNFMNHPLYYKVISVLTKNNIPWDYIPFTNFDKTINLIYDTLI